MKLFNEDALNYYKMHLLINANNKDYLQNLKNKSVNEVFKNWKKELEIGKEIFKSVKNIDENLTGDCDDFTTLVTYILKNVFKKDTFALLFIKNNACYHVCPAYEENNQIHAIDIYKFTKAVNSFNNLKEMFKYYPKASEIKIFKISEVK